MLSRYLVYLSEVLERELVHWINIGELRDREVEHSAPGGDSAVLLTRCRYIDFRRFRLFQPGVYYL